MHNQACVTQQCDMYLLCACLVTLILILTQCLLPLFACQHDPVCSSSVDRSSTSSCTRWFQSTWTVKNETSDFRLSGKIKRLLSQNSAYRSGAISQTMASRNLSSVMCEQRERRHAVLHMCSNCYMEGREKKKRFSPQCFGGRKQHFFSFWIEWVLCRFHPVFSIDLCVHLVV